MQRAGKTIRQHKSLSVPTDESEVQKCDFDEELGLTSLDRNVNRNINSAKGHHLDVKR
jgi:hypothetical protein